MLLNKNDDDPEPIVKVIGFNYCERFEPGETFRHKVGKSLYMAPEIVKENNRYSKSVDIWAIGIIMHQILTGNKHPYYDHNKDD